MRTNLPVTNIEIPLSDSFSIVSTTDLQGNITYANTYFVEVSGYSIEELIGAPQNILRHPDMPPEAFADLWATIKTGEPWTGMVKNRTKSGNHYWVLANVTPVIEGGQPVGYMSVRTKPTREQVAQAEQAYKDIRDGNSHGKRIVNGATVGTTARWLNRYSMNHRLRVSLAFIMLAFVALGVSLVWPQAVAQSGFAGVLAAAGALGAWSAVYAAYVLHTKVFEPLKLVTQNARIMAGGDLTCKIESAERDDVGQLQNALRQMNINLRSIIGDVRSNFESIRMATQEIATGNMDLSNRTESQASSLEQTAASMEQLTGTVQQSASNAAETNTLAGTASGVATQSGQVVGQMVTTMEAISLSSHRIVDIIGLIDGIAFQTNILALNAAVEAARAGDHGRGFAVVASEVRSLAQRSATAAKEIKQLIDESLIKVEAGTTLTAHAGDAMKEVIESVNRVASIISEITSATREQSGGIAQVNQAVGHLDSVTQQNAALVEQAAAAAANLTGQTDNLTDTMAIFKLPGDKAHQTAPAKVRQVVRV